MRLGQLPVRATLVDVAGQARFVAPPANAALTDAIGLLLSGILFFATDSLFLKLVAVAGGLWMGSALFTKLPQLSEGPQLTFPAPVALGYYNSTPRWEAPVVAGIPPRF